MSRDCEQFGAIIYGLAEAFGVECTPERVEVYYGHLADLRIEALSFAASEIIRNEERFPVVAVIRRHAKRWSPPCPVGDLSRPALPEFTEEQHREAARKLDELLSEFDNWGTVGPGKKEKRRGVTDARS